MCNVNAYSEAIKVFGNKDPQLMALNAGGHYDSSNNKLWINYMGTDAEVAYPSGDVLWKANIELEKNDKVLILQYLSFATAASPRNEWISFIQLPGGPHHHAPFVLDAIDPLAKEFGNDLERFAEQLRSFGGKPIKIGDYGAVLPVFPKLPMAVCLRKGDDEFPPSANLLFDAGAAMHLTTAALWVLGVEVSRKIRGVTGQQFS